ncbi:hypothetical protein HUG20_17750 [Salicibibacter cibi]|uniref:DUF8042 domain-containing protein n=1 Tax=Salicibibacter cibi TaxID=2743001 RepID=A0A7T7CGU6_9BACI|nr:hypothetical protein [Salicibibacter cibi]QQK81573.1 hypothetical protein HUG20_17750 [Salicibibacter cibi]
MNDGGMFKRVIFTCDHLINEMEESLRKMEQNSKEQMLQLFEQMMGSYEQLEITALTIDGHRQKGNIKARLTRVKRELQDAKTAVEFEQYEKAMEMLEYHLIPALKRFQEGLFPK